MDPGSVVRVMFVSSLPGVSLVTAGLGEENRLGFASASASALQHGQIGRQILWPYLRFFPPKHPQLHRKIHPVGIQTLSCHQMFPLHQISKLGFLSIIGFFLTI